MRNDIQHGCALAAIVAVMLAFVFAVAYIRSSFEAAAYKRVTGKDVTTWDAMFLDLRVSEDAR